MGKINLKFGYPTSIEEEELLSERAIKNDCTVEVELCLGFERLLETLNKRKGNENFFDLIFFLISEIEVQSPKISYDTYLDNSNRLPMLVLESDFLKVGRSEKLFISNELIHELGKIYQTEFDYEYIGFERC
jgi:hypothetical protein